MKLRITNITTNHAITYTNVMSLNVITLCPIIYVTRRRCGSVYLAVDVLRVCEGFFMCVRDV